MITFDFETQAIQSRPVYPPRPVGLSIAFDDRPPKYYAFGHLSGGNNCTEHEARNALMVALESSEPLLCHNAKFDLAVAVEHWGLPMPRWERIHDTMFLIFLLDPHARTTALKPLAADMLGLPPEEQDAVAEWVWAHRERILSETGQRVTSRKRTGAFIWCAPGDLVGAYANGDVVRTRALYAHMRPLVARYGMDAAYDRERRLLPILMEQERAGIRVDVEALGRDKAMYEYAFDYVEEGLRCFLGAPGLNFDADADVAEVLLSRGIVPQDNWSLTKTGQLSMAKDNLHPDMFTGPGGAEVASALGYRNRLATCLKMFMGPWLAQAELTGGTIHTNWHQTRSIEAGGTRTGRPATSDHNLLNLAKSWDGRDDGYRHPDFLGVPPLPLVRTYVEPDEGHVWVHRDFSGQELRIFAHFEQGDLHGRYIADPHTDPHEFVGAELMRVAQRPIERTRTKTLNFQGLYGGGVPALQRKLRCSAAEAKELKTFHDQALPGRKILVEEIKRVIRQGLPVRTIGDRLYFCEPPGPDGRSKDYKLINYIIQGSAADLTKQSIIDWHEANAATFAPDERSRFLVTVYDENNISAPRHLWRRHMLLLREIMNAPRLGMTVPMLSDGKIGESWGTAKKITDQELLA